MLELDNINLKDLFYDCSYTFTEGNIYSIYCSHEVGLKLFKFFSLISLNYIGKFRYNNYILSNMGPNEASAFRADYIGLCYENPFFMPNLNVIDNVTVTLYNDEDVEKKLELENRLNNYGLHDYLYSGVDLLNYRQTRLVDLVRATNDRQRIIFVQDIVPIKDVIRDIDRDNKIIIYVTDNKDNTKYSDIKLEYKDYNLVLED